MTKFYRARSTMPPQNSNDVTENQSQHQKEEGQRADISKGINADKFTKFEEIATTAAIIVPPDGGWGWIVMVASFLCNTVVDGIVFNSAILLEPIRNEYKVTKAYVALVSSLLAGFYLIAGPFASALANRFGFRAVTIVGTIVASACFAISHFANSVEYLFVSYGVCGGIGFCMIYIPSVLTVGYYFERWRALATGISLCGSGVGTFIFAPLTSFLVSKYGWRTTLLIQSAVILSCALFAIVYRPIEPMEIPVEEIDEEKNDRQLNDKFPVSGFRKPLPEGRFAYSVPNSAHNTYMGNPSHSHYPTAAEVFRGSGINLERKLSGTGTPLVTINKVETKTRKSQPPTPNGETVPVFTFNAHNELTTVGENEEEVESSVLLESDPKPVIVATRRHTVSGRRTGEAHSRRNSRNEVVNEARPMYRDDIFFTGSLVRIPQYTSQTSLGYHMSVTRLPTKQDLEEERGCRLCSESVRRTLSTMLDTSLLTSPSFMLLAVSGFLTMMGFFIPFMYVQSRAISGGMDPSLALFIVSAIGITNTLARIGCGILSSMNAVNALLLNNIAITAGGLVTCVSGYLINAATQYLFAVVFGICIACFSGLRSIIAVDLMGLEKLTNAFGFLMLFQGIAAAIGTPIAGIFFDMTGSYDGSFWLAGVLITVSAFLCYPLNYVSAWEKRRAESKAYVTA